MAFVDFHSLVIDVLRLEPDVISGLEEFLRSADDILAMEAARLLFLISRYAAKQLHYAIPMG